MGKPNPTRQDLLNRGLVEISKGVWGRAPKGGKFLPVFTRPHKFNAQKVVEGNEVYDSKREHSFKNLLVMHKIPYTLKVRYVIQSGFEYNGKKIKPIEIIPDFTIVKNHVSVAIVDVKGKITEVAKIKFKMLKHHLSEMGHPIPIMMPTSKLEMNKTIDELLKLLK